MGNAQIHQVNEIQGVDQGKENVVLNPVFSDLSADHDAHIGNDGRSEKKEEVDVEKGIIRLLLFRDHLFAEQQKIGEEQECKQIQQIAQFQCHGGFDASLMVSERSQDKDGDNKKNDVANQKEGLKDALKEITHGTNI